MVEKRIGEQVPGFSEIRSHAVDVEEHSYDIPGAESFNSFLREKRFKGGGFVELGKYSSELNRAAQKAFCRGGTVHDALKEYDKLFKGTTMQDRELKSDFRDALIRDWRERLSAVKEKARSIANSLPSEAKQLCVLIDPVTGEEQRHVIPAGAEISGENVQKNNYTGVFINFSDKFERVLPDSERETTTPLIIMKPLGNFQWPWEASSHLGGQVSRTRAGEDDVERPPEETVAVDEESEKIGIFGLWGKYKRKRDERRKKEAVWSAGDEILEGFSNVNENERQEVLNAFGTTDEGRKKVEMYFEVMSRKKKQPNNLEEEKVIREVKGALALNRIKRAADKFPAGVREGMLASIGNRFKEEEYNLFLRLFALSWHVAIVIRGELSKNERESFDKVYAVYEEQLGLDDLKKTPEDLVAFNDACTRETNPLTEEERRHYLRLRSGKKLFLNDADDTVLDKVLSEFVRANIDKEIRISEKEIIECLKEGGWQKDRLDEFVRILTKKTMLKHEWQREKREVIGKLNKKEEEFLAWGYRTVKLVELRREDVEKAKNAVERNAKILAKSRRE